MKKLFVSFAALAVVMPAFLVSSLASATTDDCQFSRHIERELSLSDSLLLTVVAGAGELEVIGDADRKTVLIDAKLCAEGEQQLADMNVSLELKGDATHIKTEFASGRLWDSNSNGAYIDLTVYVPVHAKLDVTDSSGQARVTGVASLVIVDSSGQLTIEDVGGNVTVEDSSGSLKIKRVNGDVSVTDTSGSIKATYIAGDFTVEADSSGSIGADYVKGNVLVRSDSSGSINANQVGGDFTVVEDSSGGIEHKDIAGKVSLPN